MANIRKRIDNLGRIVIPKEIRSQLRIREGEKLEVSTNGEDIVLKKQHSGNDISRISQQLIQFINVFVDQKIIITTRDLVVACPINLKSIYLNKMISDHLSKKIEERNFNNGIEQLNITNEIDQEETVLLEPIIRNGDVEGLVIMLGGFEANAKIVKPIAQFIAEII